MEYTELPHRHGNDRDLSRLEHCMQEAESFQAVGIGLCLDIFCGILVTSRNILHGLSNHLCRSI